MDVSKLLLLGAPPSLQPLSVSLRPSLLVSAFGHPPAIYPYYLSPQKISFHQPYDVDLLFLPLLKHGNTLEPVDSLRVSLSHYASMMDTCTILVCTSAIRGQNFSSTRNNGRRWRACRVKVICCETHTQLSGRQLCLAKHNCRVLQALIKRAH